MSEHCPECGADIWLDRSRLFRAHETNGVACYARRIEKAHQTITALRARVAELEADAERLNEMVRATGYGQGSIDAYVAQCEELDALKADVARLTQLYEAVVLDAS